MNRNTAYRCAVACAALAALSSQPVYADADGNKPVRLIVPYVTGHPVDVLAHLLSAQLAEQKSVPLVIDNRPAVDGLIGTEMVAKESVPDGHTLLIVSNEHAMYAALGRKLPYNPTKDFSPITQVADRQLLLVANPSLQVSSVKDLVALAKKEPGKLQYASSSQMLSLPMELFKMSTATKIEAAPLAAPRPLLTEVIDGPAQVAMVDAAAALPHVKQERLRALAVGDAQRSAAVPDVPTMAEAGVRGYRAALWSGLLAPPKTPKAIIERLNKQMLQAVRAPEFKEKLAQLGADPVGSTPVVWGKFIESEIVKWRKVAHTAKLKID
ncbi:MAG TPA: tripartite tricarboxylate transporter substrate-binding protein [Burkholderiales bacterium]|nr:tripartite tricarboxylate transporter substrate-binding protein [Burkholderiales bacterium]